MDQMRAATGFVLFAAAISGLNHVLSEPLARASGDSVMFTAVRVSFAAAALMVVAAADPRTRGAIPGLTEVQVGRMLGLGTLAGLPFALYFSGVAAVGAAGANLVRTSLMFLVALAAIRLFRERLTVPQGVGAGLMFAASIAVGLPDAVPAQIGAEALLVVIAALAWGAEALFAKRALADIPVGIAASGRLVVAAIWLYGLVLWRGSERVILGWSGEQWLGAVGTSILLAGYVGCWYGALKRAPVTYVATLMLAAPVATKVISALAGQPVSVGMVVIGVVATAFAAWVVVRFLPQPMPVC
ncbi:DMT family transporter [Candidatus Parcubacteria bacterium]|nr:DMT family transporter [Candidatus Parcubacteria bacterium]